MLINNLTQNVGARAAAGALELLVAVAVGAVSIVVAPIAASSALALAVQHTATPRIPLPVGVAGARLIAVLPIYSACLGFNLVGGADCSGRTSFDGFPLTLVIANHAFAMYAIGAKNFCLLAGSALTVRGACRTGWIRSCYTHLVIAPVAVAVDVVVIQLHYGWINVVVVVIAIPNIGTKDTHRGKVVKNIITCSPKVFVVIHIQAAYTM